MGKGLAARQRVKRAIESHVGNVHAQMFGKGVLSGLPEAPKDNDMTERLPRSLQRILKLKAIAEAPKHRAVQRRVSRPVPKGVKGFQREHDEDEGKPSTSGRKADDESEEEEETEVGIGCKKVQVGLDALSAHDFERDAKKTLKQSKKEFLKRKKLKRQGKAASPDPPDLPPPLLKVGAAPAAPQGRVKGQGPPPGSKSKAGLSSATPAAATANAAKSKAKALKSPAPAAGGSAAAVAAEQAPMIARKVHTGPKEYSKEVVRFGDVVDRPMQVNLKRKHWAGRLEEKPEGERCKALFLQQMAVAQQRMAAHGDLPMMHAQVGPMPGAKRPKLQADEKEALRMQAIEGYRMQKKAHKAAAGVSVASLKDLVKKNKGRPSATYTIG